MSNISLSKKSHLLGTKVRNLRKRNNLTIEDLSVRCMKIDSEAAPSVSYLSMIERGKRTPGKQTLMTIASVFQKDINWFLDDVIEAQAVTPQKSKQQQGGVSGMSLEPNVLFSNEILEIAIPELLSQAGISGSQFAHLLIRAHLERHQNHFPDLEKEAEKVGLKRMPMQLEDIYDICRQMNLSIKWFKTLPQSIRRETGIGTDHMVRSYQEDNTIYVNEALKQQTMRLKYDLANHIGRLILHGKSDLRNLLISGEKPLYNTTQHTGAADSPVVNSQEIIHAWRDFEASFFAGALLCPKVPFRQLLDRNGYEFDIHKAVDVSSSVAIRRMTAVSSYPYWHYFDAYSPGKLKAVYRGNGIPLPWGNMKSIEDPCQHWAVFRMISSRKTGTSSQISIINKNNQPVIYCCESVRVEDMTGKSHVLCAGIDLNPAITAQGLDAQGISSDLQRLCVKHGGEVKIPASIKSSLTSIAKILNINWVERGLNNPARLVCSRGKVCPREPSCYCETQAAE